MILKNMVFLIFFVLVTKHTIIAQYLGNATEVWSEPSLIDTTALNQKWKWYDTPAVTNSLDTIYFTGGNGVYCATKIIESDSINWEITRLDNNVNPEGQYAPKSCSISRDGKRLYVSNYGGYGGLDIWKSEWNDSLDNWGALINMGENINKEGSGVYLYEVSEDTVYCILNRIGLPYLYYFIRNDKTNEWEEDDSLFNRLSHTDLGTLRLYGLSLTNDKKKLYFSHQFVRKDTSITLNYSRKRSLELAVSYWDTTLNKWGEGQYLNINSIGYFPDSVNWPNFIAGGVDAYPWISEDGRTLIFSSVRNVEIDSIGNGDTNPKLYISYLQKDENGDPVSVHLDDNETSKGYILFPNYPNPFNGSTIISYNIPFRQRVQVKVYDILGREITTILDEVKPKGINTTLFNPQYLNLSSGVYIYNLITQEKNISKSMIYLK